MVYLLIAALIFTGDFFMKRHMDHTRKLGGHDEILDGRIIVRKYYNEGVIFDFLSKWPYLVRVLCGVLMLGLGCVWALLLREKGNRMLKFGMACVIGGGMSNFHDRITKGHVVDYFSFKSRFPRLQRIIFNISDLFIFLGSVILLLFRKK